MEKELLESINKRLGVIVNLLLQFKGRDSRSRSLREQIQMLNNFGLKAKEIADILSRSDTYINKELFELRKSKKVKK